MVLHEATSGARSSLVIDYQTAIFSLDGPRIFDSIIMKALLEKTEQPAYETIPF